MRKNLVWCIIVLLVLATGCEDLQEPEPAPLGLVVMIGDGMGEAAVEVARRKSAPLAFDGLPVEGTVRTASASHSITDSGAAATALSTGVSTYNGAIGVGVDSLPLPTLLEIAMDAGMSVGVVATSSVTHATPASFLAHVPSRYQEHEIARQIARSGVDLILGGGRSFFVEDAGLDDLSPIETLQSRGCRVLRASDVRSDGGAAGCVVGLLADVALPSAGQRLPTLSEMAEFAIGHLQDSPEGFVLVIEGSQIDWAAHANDGPWLIEEVVDFHRAVNTVAEILDERPNSVLVVSADHETGGLEVQTTADGELALTWSTTGHTAADVPLRASAGECFAGTQDNSEIGQLLMRVLISGSVMSCG